MLHELTLLHQLRIKVKRAYNNLLEIEFNAKDSKDDAYIKSLRNEIFDLCHGSVISEETLQRFFFLKDEEFTSRSFNKGTSQTLNNFVAAVNKRKGLQDTNNQGIRIDNQEPGAESKNNLYHYLERIKSIVSVSFIPLERNISITEILDFRLQELIIDKKENSTDVLDYTNNELLEKLNEGKNIFVDGSAGSGKSTLAKWITFSLLNENIQQIKNVPFYVELKYAGNNLHESILALLADLNIGVVDSPTTYSNYRIFLILDGLDEFGSQRDFYIGLVRILQFIPVHAVFLTSRKENSIKDSLKAGFKRYEILPLNDSEINDICDRILLEEATKFKIRLKDSAIYHLAKSKLLLYFLMSQYKETQNTFELQNKGLLLLNVIKTNFFNYWETSAGEYEKDKSYGISADQILSIAQKVAYGALKLDSLIVDRKYFISSIDNQLKVYKIAEHNLIETRNHIIERLRRSQILVMTGSEEFIFIDKVIQEFLASMEMVRLFKIKSNPLSFYKSHAGNQWIEPFEYFIGLVNDPSNFVTQIFNRFCHSSKPSPELTLCARLIASNKKIDKGIITKVVNTFEVIINRFFNGNTKRIRFESGWVYEPASLLVHIEHDKIQPILIRLQKQITHSWFFAKHKVAESLIIFFTEHKLYDNLLALYIQGAGNYIPHIKVLETLREHFNEKSIKIFRNRLQTTKGEDFDEYYAWYPFIEPKSPFYMRLYESNPFLIPVLQDFVQGILDSVRYPFFKTNISINNGIVSLGEFLGKFSRRHLQGGMYPGGIVDIDGSIYLIHQFS